MGIIENVKEIGSIIQKADNIDLYPKILDIQKQALDLVEENTSLKEEIKRYNKEEEISKLLIYKDDLYWLPNEANIEGPFCSKCWDENRKLIRKHKVFEGSYRCPSCRIVVDTIKNRHQNNDTPMSEYLKW